MTGEQGFDSTQPLTRADLDLTQFLLVDGLGEQPPADVAHGAVLPDRSGRQMIFAVWEIADTANAFYQCIDVDFGGSGGGGGGSSRDAPAWQPGTVYTDGDVVTYQGHEWRAKWWTQQRPADEQWGPWADLGAYGSARLGGERLA
ncbi:MAG: lytic polysaccharide monooxygenase [Streptosporangiaceae bacterium]